MRDFKVNQFFTNQLSAKEISLINFWSCLICYEKKSSLKKLRFFQIIQFYLQIS